MAAVAPESRRATTLRADLIAGDEFPDREVAVRLVRDCRALIAAWIAEQGGQVFDTGADHRLAAAFASPVDAVRCALDIQEALARRNAEVPPEERLACRIGIAYGEAVVDDGRLKGDGVRLAAGLLALGKPGRILVSRPVLDRIKSRLRYTYRNRGERTVVGFDRPVEVYQVKPAAGAPAGHLAEREGREGSGERGGGASRVKRLTAAAAMLLLVGLGWAAGHAYRQFATTRDEAPARAAGAAAEPAEEVVVGAIPGSPAPAEPERSAAANGEPAATAPEDAAARTLAPEQRAETAPPVPIQGPVAETPEGPPADQPTGTAETAGTAAAPLDRFAPAPVEYFNELLAAQVEEGGPPPPVDHDDDRSELPLDASFGAQPPGAAQPSLAVLPFENPRGDPAWDYFSDGVTRTLIGDLTRFPQLRVIAGDSVFGYKGADADPRQIGRDLGVRYVLRGSATRDGGDLVLKAQLIDAATGAAVWEPGYEGRFDDPSAMQRELTGRVLVNLDGHDSGPAPSAEAADISSGETSSLEAYDYGLQWRDLFNRFNAADNARAREAAQKAIELDSGYAAAHAYVAWTHLADFWWGWDRDSAAALAEGLEWAGRAVELGPRDLDALWALGDAQVAADDLDRAVATYERALAVNPNVAELLQDFGTWVLPLVGRAEEGSALAERSMRLNPHHPEWYHGNLALNYYLLGRYGDAVDAVERMKAPRPDHRLYLAASYAQLGRTGDARAVIDGVVADQGSLTTGQFLATLPFKHEADRRRMREGLEKAGLPA